MSWIELRVNQHFNTKNSFGFFEGRGGIGQKNLNCFDINFFYQAKFQKKKKKIVEFSTKGLTPLYFSPLDIFHHFTNKGNSALNILIRKNES